MFVASLPQLYTTIQSAKASLWLKWGRGVHFSPSPDWEEEKWGVTTATRKHNSRGVCLRCCSSSFASSLFDKKNNNNKNNLQWEPENLSMSLFQERKKRMKRCWDVGTLEESLTYCLFIWPQCGSSGGGCFSDSPGWNYIYWINDTHSLRHKQLPAASAFVCVCVCGFLWHTVYQFSKPKWSDDNAVVLSLCVFFTVILFFFPLFI